MKKPVSIIITGIVIVCILFFCILTVKNIIFLRREKKTSVAVHVYDGFTGACVENARVVLAETGDDSVTDADGMTDTFVLEKNRNAYADLPFRLQGNWQEVTILVYHEQYVDTAVLHVAVYPNEENVVSVELFQKNDLPNQQVVLSSQTPDMTWVDRLLMFYR